MPLRKEKEDDTEDSNTSHNSTDESMQEIEQWLKVKNHWIYVLVGAGTAIAFIISRIKSGSTTSNTTGNNPISSYPLQTTDSAYNPNAGWLYASTGDSADYGVPIDQTTGLPYDTSGYIDSGSNSGYNGTGNTTSNTGTTGNNPTTNNGSGNVPTNNPTPTTNSNTPLLPFGAIPSSQWRTGNVITYNGQVWTIGPGSNGILWGVKGNIPVSQWQTTPISPSGKVVLQGPISTYGHGNGSIDDSWIQTHANGLPYHLLASGMIDVLADSSIWDDLFALEL